MTKRFGSCDKGSFCGPMPTRSRKAFANILRTKSRQTFLFSKRANFLGRKKKAQDLGSCAIERGREYFDAVRIAVSETYHTWELGQGEEGNPVISILFTDFR